MQKTPGIYCQICGEQMEPEYLAEKRRWRFKCPHCSTRTPTRDGRGQAASAAKKCDMIERSLRAPIVCPYWIRARGDRMAIDCEPPAQGGRILRMGFEDVRSMQTHMARFCRTCWRECPIARGNEEKYKKEQPPE